MISICRDPGLVFVPFPFPRTFFVDFGVPLLDSTCFTSLIYFSSVLAIVGFGVLQCRDGEPYFNEWLLTVLMLKVFRLNGMRAWCARTLPSFAVWGNYAVLLSGLLGCCCRGSSSRRRVGLCGVARGGPGVDVGQLSLRYGSNGGGLGVPP